jgi:hypothetical protein
MSNILFFSSCIQNYFLFVFSFQLFMIHLSMDFFRFILFRIFQAFSMCWLIYFAKSMSFQSLFSSKISYVLHSFSSPSRTPMTSVLDLL